MHASPSGIPSNLSYLALDLCLVQRHAWFLDLWEGDAGTQAVTETYTIRGPLDAAAWAWCVTAEMQCHELLNLCVDLEDGRPKLRYRNPARDDVALIDLGALSSAARNHALTRLLQPTAPPPLHHRPWRLYLIKTAPEQWLMHISLHRVAADEASLHVLWRRLARLYGERLAAGPMELHEGTLGYYDLAAQRARQWATGWGTQVLHWWTGRLCDAPPLPPLRGAGPRPPHRRWEAACHRVTLPPTCLPTLVEDREDPAFFLGVTAALLRAYAGTDDLVIGWFDNRRAPEAAEMVAPFRNLVPLRFQLGNHPDPAAQVRVAKAAFQEAVHKGIPPYALLRQALGVPLEEGAPLVGVAVQVATERLFPLAVGKAWVTAQPSVLRRTRMDLELHVDPYDGTLVVVYAVDQYSSVWAEQFAGHWAAMASAACRNLEAPELTALPEASLHGEIPDVPPPTPLTAAPHGWVGRELARRLAHVQPDALSRLHAPPLQWGVDSLQLVRFVTHLRCCLGIPIGLRAFAAHPHPAETLRRLVADLPDDPMTPTREARAATPHLLTPNRRFSWLRAQVTGPTAAQQHALLLRIDGPLRVDLLARATKALFDRYPVLCFRMRTCNGLPAPYTGEASRHLPVWDLTHLTGSSGRRRAEEIVDEKCRKPFGEEEPLLRHDLIRLGRQRHRLLLVAHHHVCDARALHILAQDLTGHYQALASGGKAPAPGPDYAAYEAWLLGPARTVFRRQLTYWRAHLDGAPLLHGLTTDRGRPPIPSHETDQFEFKPASRVADALHAMTGTHHVSAEMIFQAAFAVLLYKYTDDTDLVLGLPRDNRHGQLADMVGPMENMTAMRHQVNPAASFEALLRGVRASTLAAMAFEAVPFADVAAALVPRPRLNVPPLVQLVFRYDFEPETTPSGSGMRFQPEPLHVPADRVDLTLHITACGTGFQGRLVYATDLFEVSTAAALTRHYSSLLDNLVQAPTRALETVSIHDEAELKLLLDNLNSDHEEIVHWPLDSAPPANSRRRPAAHDAPRTALEAAILRLFEAVLGLAGMRMQDRFWACGGHPGLLPRLRALIHGHLRRSLPSTRLEDPSPADIARYLADTALQATPPNNGDTPTRQPTEASTRANSRRHRLALRLYGPFSLRRLEQAWQSVQEAGSPARLTVVDLAGIPAARAEAAGQPTTTGDTGRLHMRILRRDPWDHHLSLNADAATHDVRGLTLMLKALAEAYGSDDPRSLTRDIYQGSPYPLLGCRTGADALAWWRDRLRGLPRHGGAGRGPSTIQGAAAAHRFVLPEQVGARVSRLARTHTTSQAAVLHALFAAVWARYDGVSEVCLGTPMYGFAGGYGGPEARAQCLPIRHDLSRHPHAHALIACTNDHLHDAFLHADTSYQTLVGTVHPPHGETAQALFRRVFAMVPPENEAPVFPGTESVWVPRVPGETAYELTLTMRPERDGLTGCMRYAKAAFTAAGCRRLVAWLTALIAGADADPSRPLDRIDLLTDVEREAVLHLWSGAANGSVSRKPDAHVADEAIAVHDSRSGEQVTYGTLRARASAWASRLRAWGVRTEDTVGIILPPGADLMVALRAVAVAGGTAVPMNPLWPRARLEQLIARLRMGVILSRGAHLKRLQVSARMADMGSEVRTTDTPLPVVPDSAAACVLPTVRPDGRPRDVVWTHAGRAATLAALCARIPGPIHEVHGQAPPWTAAGLTEPALATVWGATYIPPTQDPAVHPVTALTAHAEAGRPAVTTLLHAGHRLTAGAAAALTATGATVLNLYGCTETGGWVAVREVPPDDPEPGRLGPPTAGSTFYVLDGLMQPTPIGAAGRVYVGGEVPARGYAHNPRDTATHFVPDPFTDKPGSRLFATGDRGFRAEDGRLVPLGRGDRQVKIRGYRVDPAEVEAALLRLPRIRHAVVLPRCTDSGEPRPAAFLGYRGSTPPRRAAVRAALLAVLPDHMVPEHYIFLNPFPVTHGGRPDLDALPELETAGRPQEPDFHPARTTLEKHLVGLWRDVLRRKRVGVHDDFFQLGGGAPEARKLQAALKAQLGLRVPFRLFWELPTIAALAARLRNREEEPPTGETSR